MYCVFLIPFSAFRLLQRAVAPTTPGKSEGYRTLRATRSGRVHSVNNGGHDPGAALTTARYSLPPERRVTRLPVGLRVGGSAACRARFHHWSRARFWLLTVLIGHRTGPERGVSEAIQLRRCAATSCRRRAILSSKDRIGYANVSEWPCAPVPCGAEAIMRQSRRHIVSPMCHPMCHPRAGIHRDESEGVTQGVNVCERAPFPGASSEAEVVP